MCLNDCCFNFQKFSKSKVAVFISGPGNLEFPWALETALRLKNTGAQVTVFDVSDYSLTYSARIKVLGKQLPIKTRKILRGTLLKQNTRIENRISHICSSNDIPYFRSKSSKTINKHYPRKLVKISDFNDVYWGLIKANEILHTHLSSKYKKNLTDDDLVPLSLVMGIRQSIMETFDFIQNISPTEFSYYFVCNGRQPVQAALSTYLRNRGCCVYLYEGGGGYVFPEILNRHIDYWETSPANHIESQSKILCLKKVKNFDEDLTSRVILTFRTQTSIPYGLDFLTKTSPKFDAARLGGANNYAFFATSQFEFSILHKYKRKAQFFQNQIDAVQSILSNINANDKLFIRLHPSDPNMPIQHDREWEIFRTNSQVEIIDSDNRLNSYSLAKSMKANFVWESTIGYEFAVANIPVAIMSESALYAPCMEEICVYDEERLKKFLTNPISPKFKSLLSYANYLAHGGFQIEYSREEPCRRIFLLDEQVDIYKKIFKLLPDRIRINIT
jgi:hypothetical protein